MMDINSPREEALRAGLVACQTERDQLFNENRELRAANKELFEALAEAKKQRDLLLQENAELREKQMKGDFKNRKLRDKMRWIPVKARMPQERGKICKNVILAFADGFVTVGWLNEDTEKVYYLNERDDVVFWKNIDMCTHWMPLPEPPEMKNKKVDDRK